MAINYGKGKNTSHYNLHVAVVLVSAGSSAVPVSPVIM